MILSIASIIIGIIVALVGASKFPSSVSYTPSNPAPSDPQVAADETRNLILHSYGYYLVIIGSSLLGTGSLLLFGSCVSLCYIYRVHPDRINPPYIV